MTSLRDQLYINSTSPCIQDAWENTDVPIETFIAIYNLDEEVFRSAIKNKTVKDRQTIRELRKAAVSRLNHVTVTEHHKDTLMRLRVLNDVLLSELELHTHAALVSMSKRGVMATEDRIDSHKKLVESTKSLIALERVVYGIDGDESSGNINIVDYLDSIN